MKNNGVKLSFGTEEIGRSSMEVRYANSWLTLNFFITADKDTINMEVKDVESNEFEYIVSNDEFEKLNMIEFDNMIGFNNTIETLLAEVIGYDSVELNGFELIGLAIDLD